MTVTRFQDLIVWQRSRLLCHSVYLATGNAEFHRDYALRNQVRRAAISVMSNIAEGFSRYSSTEFKRFLAISHGSLSEVESQLYLAHDLGYVDAERLESLHNLCQEIGKMLGALRARTGREGSTKSANEVANP